MWNTSTKLVFMTSIRNSLFICKHCFALLSFFYADKIGSPKTELRARCKIRILPPCETKSGVYTFVVGALSHESTLKGNWIIPHMLIWIRYVIAVIVIVITFSIVMVHSNSWHFQVSTFAPSFIHWFPNSFNHSFFSSTHSRAHPHTSSHIQAVTQTLIHLGVTHSFTPP